MDQICLRALPPARNQNSEYVQFEILINDRPLLELLRTVEAPLVDLERAERAAAGGTGSPEAAGYMYPTRRLLRQVPCQFFGLIEDLFPISVKEPQRGKTCLLGCNCGTAECWPLLVRISRTASTVTWSDFSQFHRNWAYELGPFQFDSSDYDREFERSLRED